MCRRARTLRRRWIDERGQSISEYVALSGLAAAIAIFVTDALGLSVRQAFQQATLHVLSVITGHP